MAKEDYVVNLKTSEVVFKEYPVARFNSDTREVTEYLADGVNRKRWIKEALDECPKETPLAKEEDLDWLLIENIVNHKTDFYDSFPGAPRPQGNLVGFKHVDVFNWVQKHYSPELVDHLYPDGAWNAVAAGMEGRKDIRPTKDIKIEYVN